MDDEKPITRRAYMTREVLREGATLFLAQEAVSSTALEHPEWNMDELVNPRTGKPIKRPWYEIDPADAVDITLPHSEIQGPLTTEGEECPWPWEPQQLKGAPIGQYHCGFCGEMVLAGAQHIDYRDGA